MNQGSKTRQQLLLKTSEQNLEERLRFETLLSDISARFMVSSLDQVDSEILNALRRIMEFFRVDRCGLLEFQKDKGFARITHAAFGEGLEPISGELNHVIKITVGNVVKGVLGVAFIQATLIGIGFFLAGIPYPGIWTLLVFLLAVLQIPPLLVVLPVAVYLFSERSTGTAIGWTVYLFLGGFSDNILKPVLLGKGAPVPMLVIFLGVIGGFMLSGFIGLFTGAVVMSIGYKLFTTWINTGPTAENPVE